MRKRRLGKDEKRGVTPEFVNMSKEILYPQIQGVTGFKTKEQSISKAALVWRTGLSGVSPDSVRCTTGQCSVHQGDRH
jgi:hypothetical protein